MLDEDTFVEANAYASRYDFNLFSNFTFFLEDSENGDQIEQKEKRNLFGMNTVLRKKTDFLGAEASVSLGGGFRTDIVEGN